MYLLLFLVWLLVGEENATSCPNTTATGETKPLYLLTLVPIPHEAGREGRLTVLPGAYAARDEINNHTDILPGYHIELIIKNIETCPHTVAGIGLTNLVKYTVSPPCHPVVAVTGLLCSSHTLLLSTVAGHDGYDLIQLTAANSPIFKTQNYRFPHLWQLLGSATLYTDTVLAIMDQYNWTRVGVVYDTIYIHIVEHLVQTFSSSNNKSVVFSTGITSSQGLLSTIRKTKTTVIVTVLDHQQAIALQSSVQKKTTTTWIHIKTLMQTHQFTDDSVIHNYYIHGCFILQLQISHTPEGMVLKTDNTHMHTNRNTIFGKNQTKILNSLLHDQVWALALALNKSLPLLKIRNLSIDNYTIGQHEVTDVIEQQLANLSFQGASGWIEFNQYRSVSSPVEVFWVFRNKTDRQVGIYDPLNPSDFHINIDYSLLLSNGELGMSYISLPTAILLYILSGAVIMFTTAQLILYIHYRHHKVIKATSPHLSLLIFLGCYLLCLAAVCTVTIQSMVIPCVAVKVLYYTAFLMAINGLGFIFLTLFVRLMRIYRIFSKWMKKDLGKYWSNFHLLLVIFVLIIIPNIFLVARIAIGSGVIFIECTLSDDAAAVYVDFALVASCGVVYLLLVCMLGTLNRNIKNEHFNDARQIYLLISVEMVVLLLGISLYTVYILRKEVTIAEPILVIELLVVNVICQMFLFLPKISHVMMDKYLHNA